MLKLDLTKPESETHVLSNYDLYKEELKNC